jgi:hypothetical protein
MRASVVCSIKQPDSVRRLNKSDIRIEPDTAFQLSPRPAFQFIDVTYKNSRQTSIQWSKSTLFKALRPAPSVRCQLQPLVILPT